MFKLVVLFAFVAFVAAKPSYLGGHAAYTAFAGPAVALPAAVSHQYRTDVISKPIIATYAAPVVHKTVFAAPVVQKAVVAAPLALSAAVTHQSRVDLHTPFAYAAHVHAAPLVHSW